MPPDGADARRMSSSPGKTLRRILLISALDGWSVTLFAGLCAVISLLLGEWIGVVVGILVTAGGVFELRGRSALVRGEADGIACLVRAQLLILATIWVYSLANIVTYDEAKIMAAFTPELRDALTQAGLSIDELQRLIKPAFFGFYAIVMGVTLLFQGGLARYYHSRRAAVAGELADASATPPLLPSR